MLITELRLAAHEYAKTQEGKWLNDINWREIPVITISELPWDILGFYGFGRVVLLDTNINIIFSTYIHELRHRWQWEQNKFKYILGKIYRPLIEDDADIETAKADEFIMNR